MKPQFKHHCESCVLLGRVRRSVDVFPNFTPGDKAHEELLAATTTQHVDLYACPKEGVVSRYSDRFDDYANSLNSALPDIRIAGALIAAKASDDA